MDDTSTPHLWQRRHELVFTLAVSYSYHRKRQRFFDLLDKGTKAATVLLSASLLGEWVKAHLPLVASAIAALGLLALVFGYGERKQAHKELAQAFMRLRGEVDQTGQSEFTAEQLDAWAAELARLDASEPPNLRALVTLCQNEQAIALGHPGSVHRLPAYQRLLANWLSFSGV